MPNAQRSKAFALLLVWLMVASIFVVARSASAAATPSAGLPADASSSSLVSTDGSSVPTPSLPEEANNLLGKIAPEIQDAAFKPEAGVYADVVFHTMDVPALGAALEAAGARSIAVVDGQLRVSKYVARPWGAVGVSETIHVQVLQSALLGLAAQPFVQYIDPVLMKSAFDAANPSLSEEQTAFQAYKDRVRAGVKNPIHPMGTSSSVSPTSWGIAREHKAWDVWNLNVGGQNIEGQGVNVAVIDTGEDFGNPSLANRWAVAPAGSPWAGWPIMFHPASMEGLMSDLFWTQDDDMARTPLPFWLSVNDGDTWYTNMDFTTNDTNLDGYLAFRDNSVNPLSGNLERTARENPQQYGNYLPTFNNRINRDYWVGLPTDASPPHIISKSGFYRIGLSRDDTLTGLWGKKVGMLLVDSTTPFVYDTVYVDLNFNLDFTDDKPVTKASPLAVADLNGDGIQDISGGLLYFIASSQWVTNEQVINPITGTEASATLANGWVAVNITGHRNFNPPVKLWLNDGAINYWLPGATEDFYEDFTLDGTLGAGAITGAFWDLGSDPSFAAFVASRTPATNTIDFQVANSAKLLRGPGSDFALRTVLDVSDNNGGLVEGADYNLDMNTGRMTFLHDYPDNDIISITYQFDSYRLEPVSGTLSLLKPLPTGWSLWADYETGLPIPYSQIYGPAHGYDTFIPANGQLVAFHGEFDYQQSHGSFVTSTIAAHPFGNLADPTFEVFGTAPQAHVIGIAACCNVAGPIGLFGSIEDMRTFAATGYDGVPATGDEGVIMSNSFGDPGSRNTGYSFEDRWLIDYWNNYPTLTPLIALGNNGPGYATSAPGGSSPGVIGVGAGTSGDYRWEYGNDLGDAYWELPNCPPPPIDPKDCVGIGASSGSGPGPYGDNIFFSSRGPTLMGTPKPDIVSIGGYAVEGGPLNVFGGVPSDLDGNFAFDIFSGTSQATPVTAGVSALIAQAYNIAHGSFPTNAQLKALLKSGADDMHKDILTQGAGWTNALRSVRSAIDGVVGSDGVTSNTDYWLPGGYNGVHRVGFVNLLAGGQSDTKAITLTNHNSLLAKTVNVKTQVYQRAASFSYSFSLATGTNQWYIAKADGLYNRDGNVNIGGPTVDFRPYWNTADFVKVTLAYNASSYIAATSLRLDTFDWYDSNGNGLYDQDGAGCIGTPPHGCGERNRMTVDAPGAGANSVWDAIYHPAARIHDGWALNPRGGAAAAIPATFIIEFYQRAPWAWVTTNIPGTGNVLIAGNGGTASFNVIASVPTGTPAGMYEGAVYVNDSGKFTTIPVLINVPVSGFPVLLGGNAPSTSLYDNNGVIQGARSNGGWLQIGDSRYVYANISVASAPGRKMIYNAILKGPISDPEMFVYSLNYDATFTDYATFGPGYLNILSRTRDLVGSTTSLYPNRDIMSSDPISGLIAFQVKSWGSMAETEQLEANIGIMQTTPTLVNIATNKVVGTKFVSVWSDVPLYDGLATAATSSTDTTLTNQVVRQDNPNDPCTASYVYPVTLTGVISFTVTITGTPGTDIDLYLRRDNLNGVYDCPGDAVVRSSTSSTPNEQVSMDFPPDGLYFITVHGWSVPAGTTTFTNKYSITQTGGTSNFRGVCPTTTIPPNTPSGCQVEWRFPGDQAPGPQSGFLFVSPGYAPYALVQLLNIAFVLDYTPPSVDPTRDLSPVPTSLINDAAASVVANIGDPAGQIDRFSVQLLVDGMDVTSASKVLVPYSSTAPVGYSLLTIAWEHPTMRFSDGTHSAVVNCKDMAGNLLTYVWGWTVDTMAPNLAITSPSSDGFTNQVSWAFTARTDPGSTVTVTSNGVAQIASVSPEGVVTATIAFATDGVYTIVVTSADALGNTATASRTVTRDTAAPVLFATADLYGPTNRDSTVVTGNVNEHVVEVLVNGQPVTIAADGSFTAVVALVEGTNRIVVSTQDDAGNTASVTLATITRDTVAPTIRVQLLDVNGDPVLPVITSIDTQNVTVSVTIPDTDVFFVTINGQSVVRNAQGKFVLSQVPLAVGDNTFVIRAQDEAGNGAESVASVSYAPVVVHETANYNSVIASGVAVVLLIVGFVVGYLLSGRGGGARPTEAKGESPTRAEEELPREEERAPEEEEL